MKVSVITPLFNYRDYIQDNIKSFLNQNFNSAELIIVDDASSDNPTEVIKKFKDDRIKYIRLDKNYGYSYAKNVGIKAAKAKHIVMLDADDMLTENGIKVRYKKIIQGYDFVHGPVLDLRGDKLKRSKLWKRENRLDVFWSRRRQTFYNDDAQKIWDQLTLAQRLTDSSQP